MTGQDTQALKFYKYGYMFICQPASETAQAVRYFRQQEYSYESSERGTGVNLGHAAG